MQVAFSVTQTVVVLRLLQSEVVFGYETPGAMQMLLFFALVSFYQGSGDVHASVGMTCKEDDITEFRSVIARCGRA